MTSSPCSQLSTGLQGKLTENKKSGVYQREWSASRVVIAVAKTNEVSSRKYFTISSTRTFHSYSPIRKKHSPCSLTNYLALKKNFKAIETRPAKVKATAIVMLGEMMLDALVKRAKLCRVDVLEIFAAKMHKVECLFRAIITERELRSPKEQVSATTSEHLNILVPEDPYKVKSSDCLVEMLGKDIPGVNATFVDVEQLF